MTTIGSWGDLHPFIAVGQALLQRGHQVTLAVPEDHVTKVRAAGLDAVAITPSFTTIRQRMGLSETDAVERAMEDPLFLVEQVLMPSVAETARALDALLVEADVLVGSISVLGASIAAEKHWLPLVGIVLQPMSLFSRYDPPSTPAFRLLAGHPSSRARRRWNSLMYGIMRRTLRRRYSKRINAIRADQGLPSTNDVVLFDQCHQAALTLCCYSPTFAPLPPDAPETAEAVGFPTFDSQSGLQEDLDPHLAEFLEAGPAPLIFTLGSFAVLAPGNFFAEAARLARRLGKRAVLLAGEQDSIQSQQTILVCRYAPYSLLFPQASAIVHHGGAGTTGQALRAGKPQLVVPHMGDQYDNACRVERLGVGRALPARNFSADTASVAISALLNGHAVQARAREVGALVAAENGAKAAAMAVERIAYGELRSD